MRVNEIETPARIETRTDAYRILYDETQRESYIAEYGNVVVEYDRKFDVYRVPSLKTEIRSYCRAKAADCAVWGCD
jgi:hypothetical protein